MIKSLVTGILFMAVAGVARGQEERYDFSFAGATAGEVVAGIERQCGARFSYASALLEGFPAVTMELSRVTLREVLERVFAARGITYRVRDNYIILGRARRRGVTVSGTVLDASSREPLVGATIHDPAARAGTTTNEHGSYSLSLAAGPARLVVSFVGYAPVDTTLALAGDTVLRVALRPNLRLEEVTVVGQVLPAWIHAVQPGQARFPVKVVNSLPALLGESDVLKTLQLLPGVKTGNEGLAGLYVRGGNVDENLYLMDDIPVYNPSHLAGFFSTFNPDAVKHVDFYKGSFPARHGGRLSSVVDARLKEGNTREVHGNVSAGLLASKFTVEGPIERERSSFLLSARRTYMDLFLPSLVREFTTKRDGGTTNYSTATYYFTDVNAKVTRDFPGQRKLSLGLYRGNDRVKYANRDRSENAFDGYTTLALQEHAWQWEWGNLIATAEYGARVNDRLYSRYLLAYNRYVSTINVRVDSSVSASDGKESHQLLSTGTRGRYHSGIEDVMAKAIFEYNASARHLARFGGEAVYHRFTPEASHFVHLSAGDGDASQAIEMKNRSRGGEISLFAEDDISLDDRTRLFPGARVTLFRAGDATYLSLEPRLSLHRAAGERVTLKASYSAMSQYVHLLAFGGVSLPSDLWVPVTGRVRPARASQLTAGIYYRPRPGWEVTAEGYYKRVRRLIECVDGATLLPAYRNWEENVATGNGESHGLELQLQRHQGATTGWINYTLAWAYRRFPGKEINHGRRYPARGDSRHGVNAVLLHRFSDRFDVSAAWVYHSGTRATLPLETYDGPVVEGAAEITGPPRPRVAHVEYRNNYQLPDYHRLDVGCNFHRRARRFTSTWNASVYNLYSRMNPFFVFMDSENVNGTGRAIIRQASIFPVIPSVSYSITF